MKVKVEFMAEIPNEEVRVCDYCKYLNGKYSPVCLLGDKKLKYNNYLRQITRPKGCVNASKGGD